MIEIMRRPVMELYTEDELTIMKLTIDGLKNQDQRRIVFSGFDSRQVFKDEYQPPEQTISCVDLPTWKLSIKHPGGGGSPIEDAWAQVSDGEKGFPAIGVYDLSLLTIRDAAADKHVPVGNLVLEDTCLRIVAWDL